VTRKYDFNPPSVPRPARHVCPTFRTSILLQHGSISTNNIARGMVRDTQIRFESTKIRFYSPPNHLKQQGTGSLLVHASPCRSSPTPSLAGARPRRPLPKLARAAPGRSSPAAASGRSLPALPFAGARPRRLCPELGRAIPGRSSPAQPLAPCLEVARAASGRSSPTPALKGYSSLFA
jgi:hypothetical protein